MTRVPNPKPCERLVSHPQPTLTDEDCMHTKLEETVRAEIATRFAMAKMKELVGIVILVSQRPETLSQLIESRAIKSAVPRRRSTELSHESPGLANTLTCFMFFSSVELCLTRLTYRLFDFHLNTLLSLINYKCKCKPLFVNEVSEGSETINLYCRKRVSQVAPYPFCLHSISGYVHPSPTSIPFLSTQHPSTPVCTTIPTGI